MQKSCIVEGFLSIALALVVSLPAAAQSSTTTAPQGQPPMATSPQSGPSQSAAPAPSQPASGQSGASAEAAPGPAHAQAQTDEDNPLNLTDDQKAKLRPILMDENLQLQALRNDTSMTQEQKVAKANQIRQAAAPKIKSILKPEQLQKLADMQQKARQQQNQTPANNAPPQK